MKQCLTLLWLFTLLGISAFRADAQVNKPATHSSEDHDHHHENSVYGDSLDGFNPDAIMAVADSKNLTPLEAAMFLGRAQREYVNLKYNLAPNSPAAAMYSRLAPLPNNVQSQPPCTNMDFEMGGFFGWTGSIGDNNLSSAGPLQNIVPGIFSTVMDALVTDCNARHTIMSSASGNDPCAPMPTVAPGGNFSVRLGNSCASYQGEILEQTFTVGPGNTSFTYQYAVVLNDGGHLAGEQPYFSIEMFDQNGNSIPCSPYYVEASGSIPGFVQCQPTIFYKPWTTVNIDLQSYVGQNVTIRFTAAGCIYGGHYGYAYIDASCLQYIITQTDSLCPGSSIQLTAPVGAQSYLWLPGNQTSQTITVNTPGTYTVTMTSVTNCTTQLTAVVTQYPQPTAAFTPAFPPCSNVYTFNNNSTISTGSMTYHWDFGEPANAADTSNLTSPVWTYNTPGSYTVTLIVTSGNGCSDTITQVVNPGNAGLANFSSTEVCLNNPTSFTDMSAPSTFWSWHFGEPSSGPADSSNLQNPTHTYSTPGTYTVTLIAGTSPCPSIMQQTVIVNALPTAQFTYNQLCGSDVVYFTNTSTIISGDTISGVSWNFGDPASGPNNISTAQAPQHVFSAAGTYTVILTVTSVNNCQSTVSQQIVVGPLLSAAFNAPSVCTNTPMSFTDMSSTLSGNIVSWTWDFGDGSPIVTGQANPTHTYTTTGSFQVTLVVTTSTGCIDTLVSPVSTTAPPVPLFAADTLNGCSPLCVNFTDQSTVGVGAINAWLWDFGDGSTPSINQNPQHCYTTPGTYDVTITVSSGPGCSSTLTYPAYITAYPSPVAIGTATPPVTTVVNTDVDFADISTGNPVTWSWDFGDPSSLNDTSSAPTAEWTYPQDAGSSYTVTLTVSNQYGCTDDTTLIVTVAPEFTFFIPNAFTPNGDGKNETFFGQGIGIAKYEMWIFDRWGNLIFTATDINDGWDGKVQGGSGKLCQQDVYVWRVNIVDVYNKKHQLVGHVTIAR
jgi:gliding motility-associated-like protein